MEITSGSEPAASCPHQHCLEQNIQMPLLEWVKTMSTSTLNVLPYTKWLQNQTDYEEMLPRTTHLPPHKHMALSNHFTKIGQHAYLTP